LRAGCPRLVDRLNATPKDDRRRRYADLELAKKECRSGSCF
jgi:hypothetical protein